MTERLLVLRSSRRKGLASLSVSRPQGLCIDGRARSRPHGMVGGLVVGRAESHLGGRLQPEWAERLATEVISVGGYNGLGSRPGGCGDNEAHGRRVEDPGFESSPLVTSTWSKAFREAVKPSCTSMRGRGSPQASTILIRIG